MTDPAPLDPAKCPHCGGKRRRTEKDTSSGRDMQEWTCGSCGRYETLDLGPALWTRLGGGGDEPKS